MQRAFFFTYQKSGLAHEKSPLLSDLMLPEKVTEKDQKLRSSQIIHKSTTSNITQSLPEGEILRRLQITLFNIPAIDLLLHENSCSFLHENYNQRTVLHPPCASVTHASNLAMQPSPPDAFFPFSLELKTIISYILLLPQSKGSNDFLFFIKFNTNFTRARNTCCLPPP